MPPARTPIPSRAIGLTLFSLAVAAAPAAASNPELPPNAHGHVVICPDAAGGGLQTAIIPEAELESALTEGTIAVPCAVAPGADAYGPPPDPEKGCFSEEIADGLY